MICDSIPGMFKFCTFDLWLLIRRHYFGPGFLVGIQMDLLWEFNFWLIICRRADIPQWPLEVQLREKKTTTICWYNYTKLLGEQLHWNEWTLNLELSGPGYHICGNPKTSCVYSGICQLYYVHTALCPILEWLWLDSYSSFGVAPALTSQQLVLNKSLKVDIKVESSAPHWLHVAKNSPGIGSVRSLSKLIKAVAFCVRGICDVFIQGCPAKISTYRSWICKIDSSVAQAPLIFVL